MSFNNICSPRSSLLLTALAALVSACGKEPAPEVPVRPVRSEVVAGGASAGVATNQNRVIGSPAAHIGQAGDG